MSLDESVQNLLEELRNQEAARAIERKEAEEERRKQNETITNLLTLLTNKSGNSSGEASDTPSTRLKCNIKLEIDETQCDNVAQYFRQLESSTLYVDASDKVKRSIIVDNLTKLQFRQLDERLKSQQKEPINASIAEIKEALTSLYDTKLSLFRRRDRLFRMEWKGIETETFPLFMARARGMMTEFNYASLTEASLLNLAIFLSLRDPSFEALRIRLLERLADNPDLDPGTVETIVVDYYANLQDQRLPEERAPTVCRVSRPDSHDFSRKHLLDPTSQQSSEQRCRPTLCYSCGAPDHLRSQCPAKDSKCSFCNKIGHLVQVCFKKNRTAQVHSQSVHVFQVNPFAVDPSTIPGRLYNDISINGHSLSMLFDTGSDISILSLQDYLKIGQPPKRDPFQCHAAGKQSFRLEGSCLVDLQSTNQVSCKFKIYVADVNESIMGRDLMNKLSILPQLPTCNLVRLPRTIQYNFKPSIISPHGNDDIAAAHLRNRRHTVKPRRLQVNDVRHRKHATFSTPSPTTTPSPRNRSRGTQSIPAKMLLPRGGEEIRNPLPASTSAESLKFRTTPSYSPYTYDLPFKPAHGQSFGHDAVIRRSAATVQTILTSKPAP